MKCIRCKMCEIIEMIEHESYYCNNCGARYELLDDSGA